MGIYADRALLEQKSNQDFIQAINEVYFGRTASINSLFNAYCDWREPFISTTKYSTASIKNFYNKDLQVFIDKTCKQFGLESFSYIVLNSEQVNSFTLYVTGERGPKNIEITKNGYRFKSNPAVAVGVYSGLCFNPEYTNEEVFAIFLHEIGHNFQTSANKTSFSLSIAAKIFNFLEACAKAALGNTEDLTGFLVSGIVTANPVVSAFNKIDNSIKFNEAFGNIYSALTWLKAGIESGLDLINSLTSIPRRPINLIMSGIYSMISLLLNPINSIDRYYDERFADGFAASYGFAEPLKSALSKFDGKGISRNAIVDDAIGSIPVVSHLYAAACLPGLMLCSAADEHPSFEARAYSILKDLKTDLKDPNLSPQLKKQIEKEIKEYEDSMDRYFKESKKLSNPSIVSVLAQEYIYYKCDGGTKLKLSELPFNKIGGYRAETNYTIKQTKII